MSTKQNDGGPAFPNHDGCDPEEGMSLRDWFAGQVLTGLVVARCITTDDQDRLSEERGRKAKSAYALADAMLKAREAQP